MIMLNIASSLQRHWHNAYRFDGMQITIVV